jgi:hypothetical protein
MRRKQRKEENTNLVFSLGQFAFLMNQRLHDILEIQIVSSLWEDGLRRSLRVHIFSNLSIRTLKEERQRQ